jgi:sec-independent protein translocase protein TatA
VFGLGVPELVIILVIILIIFGPSKLPQLAKSIGQGVKALRTASTEEETDAKKEADKADASTKEKSKDDA